MATATKKKAKKSTTKRRVAGGSKPESNGKAKTAGQSNKFAPEQKALVPDVDERIPELTEECEGYLAADEKRKSSKVDRDERADKIGSLLKEHELQSYVLKGKKFFIEPGEPSVKVVKVKQNG